MSLSERSEPSRSDVQEPLNDDTPGTLPENVTAVDSWADVAKALGADSSQSPPSGPVEAERERRRKPASHQKIQAIVLFVLMVMGIAAVIGLRHLAETFSPN